MHSKDMPPPLPQPAPDSSECRLLVAAEELILESGLHTVRTRALADRAGVQMAMIRYCFGGMDGLLHSLLTRNLWIFAERQRELMTALPENPDLEDILYALLTPTTAAAAFTPAGTAAQVIKEIMVHSNAPVLEEDERIGWLQQGMLPLLAELVKLCPHLQAETAIWRFCCVCAGWMDFTPRAPAWQYYMQLTASSPRGGTEALDDLVATAAGALSAGTARART
jgi:AcrR family transcriptional regulator